MKAVVLVFGVLMLGAQQAPQEPQAPEHNPVACARNAGFRNGEAVHACACKRMGQMDGETCAPAYPEDRACKAYCALEKCSCPIHCDIPDAHEHQAGH